MIFQVKVTSAIIHSYKLPSPKISELYYAELPHIQENSSIERLPEENVSIVETMECREERPETVRGMMNGVARRKLYFNPAYFEPELLIVSYHIVNTFTGCSVLFFTKMIKL